MFMVPVCLEVMFRFAVPWRVAASSNEEGKESELGIYPRSLRVFIMAGY